MHNTNCYLFGGATYLFVFISGFLFYYLSYKYNYITYIKKKLINVIMPFIIITIPLALCFAFADPNVATYLNKAPKIFKFLICFIQGAIVNQSMWYMGMIVIFFLLAPIFIKIQKNKLILITVTLCSIIYTLKTGRIPVPFPSYDTGITNIIFTNIMFYVKQFFYFLSAYLLGILSCKIIEEYNDTVKTLSKKIFGILLICFLFDFVIHLFVLKINAGNSSLQKILECILILSLFIGFEDKIKNNKILDKVLNFLAEYSFGIFFVHSIVLNVIFCQTIFMRQTFGYPAFVHKNTLHALFYCIELYFVVLFTSLAILWITKKILKFLKVKNTRMFIGV